MDFARLIFYKVENFFFFADSVSPICYIGVCRPDGNQPAPLVALQRNLSLGGILTAARPVVHKSIITFRQLRQDVLTEIAQAEQMAGIKVRDWRYPIFYVFSIVFCILDTLYSVSVCIGCIH